jgi:hypothetical protein
LGGGLILWNEQTDQLLSKICGDGVYSIKRVITTNNYLIKTYIAGVMVVTINDLKSNKFSLKHLLDAKESSGNFTGSLQLQITDSHITVATTQNESMYSGHKSIIKLMKVPIVAEM